LRGIGKLKTEKVASFFSRYRVRTFSTLEISEQLPLVNIENQKANQCLEEKNREIACRRKLISDPNGEANTRWRVEKTSAMMTYKNTRDVTTVVGKTSAWRNSFLPKIRHCPEQIRSPKEKSELEVYFPKMLIA
jgi:hypothetical protein